MLRLDGVKKAQWLMANPEHLAILEQGVEVWNRWREENPEVLPNIVGADLQVADLNDANFSKVNLDRADLSRADLIATNLHEADLHATNLREANLYGAILSDANLRNATLSGAILSGANLSDAILRNANLNHANLNEAKLSGANLGMANLSRAELIRTDLEKTLMWGITFADNDLSTAKGLEKVVHIGGSFIDIKTLFRSKGKIPYVFLRGTGVPEILIDYLPSLMGTGIEFYSLFISYSTADEEFATRLHADLQAKGVRCWFAPHDMRSGKKVHKQIDEAIHTYDRLLLILSLSSMKSNWVETEISKARKREVTEKKQVLYPISLCSFQELRDWECFDSDTGKDSAREIREYFIPDFSNWKDHDSYQKAFEELMKDLNKKIDPF